MVWLKIRVWGSNTRTIHPFLTVMKCCLYHILNFICLYAFLCLWTYFVCTMIGYLLLFLCHTALMVFLKFNQKQCRWDDNLLENYYPRLNCFWILMHHGRWPFVYLYYNNETKDSVDVSFLSSLMLSTLFVLSNLII